MTLRISKYAVVCGLSLLTLPGVVTAQVPRYQSPITTPAPQTKLNLPAPSAITPNGEVVEDVVVQVNDQIISRSDVERSEQQLAQELQQTNASPSDAAERQKNLLRDMIDQQLLLSRGKELGLNVDNEVIRRLDEIRKQNKLDSMEDLEKAARQQGVSFEDFKAQIRNSLITQQVVRDEVGRHLQMTQAQEQAYYDAHKQEYAQPEQVHLSEILIPTAADANDAAVAQAQAKAAEVETKLKAGAKFDDLAKTYSGGPTASQGGDLGQFKRGALAKVLEDQTFSLKTGENTAPIRTRQGFVILKVDQHDEAGTPPLKQIEPQIQEAMYSEQMNPKLREYLTHLREDAYIDTKPGYVDSGASAKQTKPVFLAYAPPVVKKKKVVEKQRFDRGGRFSTASSAPDAPVATTAGATAAATGTASATSSPALAKISRGKKVKKEKIRFGQAPRNSLPAQPTGMAADEGLGTDHAGEGQAAAAAPGTAIAPIDQSSTNTADANPLTPVAPAQKKTRYSARAKQVAVAKKQKKVAKVKEKSLAAPTPMTAEEKAAAATQAAPLGLNGDTATKKKKKKRAKGAAKERLQNQQQKPAPPPPDEIPSKGPDRGTPLEGTAGQGAAKPAPDTTTTPPAPAPTTPPGN
ncbi:peptidylprolyl isomerase [Granulicella arctica]|uniref:peptidylprolyl isomerase n=1 Tax=Granulicella arctica TaxID=940613 RepID=A0A7Y9PGW9_9BACT|nr:peptidylprolyl isomerase [Granulicella arctica]NYF79500.1 peptidyl-prolyl cis-trans isomerase SurA [Granulicella arctica]